jgi:hypothetical protein
MAHDQRRIIKRKHPANRRLRGALPRWQQSVYDRFRPSPILLGGLRRLHPTSECRYDEAIPAGNYMAARASKPAALFLLASFLAPLINRSAHWTRKDIEQHPTTDN